MYGTLPVADSAQAIDGRGLVGWNYPDEPEGYGLPASALPDLPPAASSGRLRFLTSTYHFYRNAAPLAPGRGHEIYAPYWAKADAIGFDLYPLEKLCSHRLYLRDGYEAQRQLTQEVAGKPTYQWIETGPLEGECGWTVRRCLTDGSTHRIVKVAHDAAELERRLAGLGWQVRVTRTSGHFFWGEGTRAQPARSAGPLPGVD